MSDSHAFDISNYLTYFIGLNTQKTATTSTTAAITITAKHLKLKFLQVMVIIGGPFANRWSKNQTKTYLNNKKTKLKLIDNIPYAADTYTISLLLRLAVRDSQEVQSESVTSYRCWITQNLHLIRLI